MPNATADQTPSSQLTKNPSKKIKPTARVRKRLQDAPPVTLTVTNLAHDGRGVATYGDQPDHHLDKHGKKVFVSFALPNETVSVKITGSRKSMEEGDAALVLANPNPERTTPPCPHFGVCGGCSLQHWQPDGQIQFKQSVLAELLEHQAHIQPENWLPPLVADRLGYRTKARMGVRYVEKKGTALVGFRERASNFLANLNECHILDPRVGFEIENLKALISSLDARDHIPQLELAMGETLDDVIDSKKSIAVIVRHMVALGEDDIAKLQAFFAERNWQLFLQPKGSDTVHRIDPLYENTAHARPSSLTVPPTGGLFYRLPESDVTFEFSPLDFTQVNLSVNRKMTKLAIDLLDLKPGERVLDLFCGLGNFSLPLARQVGETGFVIGVEGSSEMTQRAKMNASANGLHHTDFFAQDLTKDFSSEPWVGQVDALLIDPPRSGALEVMQYLDKFNAKRIVYVSCNPITLARDTAVLLDKGYKLTHAGVMDMFCHTGHVESIARFEKR
ncbi:23S rRNA (uracil(1939)-C(5))-methyltransferase RlmD [Moraxella osloensis]|uniref:23S rRNA (uracil(1939)-C(5))-methyltransferase RlmD n=1 Tax=Faucicola osloensis TaxID=34062 RepID=A0AAW6T9N6_FAUOS|nr:23S rRNA (uracil(1939)-C(5))-methyltransferase RlmD [Moraxella osloensis]MDI4509374.1 23S rRNA (uracil(1939)-C(5))-methyltransferase RlmD [Moraxella osloensis]